MLNKELFKIGPVTVTPVIVVAILLGYILLFRKK